MARAEALGNEILALCVAYGGSVTGEHGVGVEKLDAMCGQFEAPELTRFKALKAAFDPLGDNMTPRLVVWWLWLLATSSLVRTSQSDSNLLHNHGKSSTETPSGQ